MVSFVLIIAAVGIIAIGAAYAFMSDGVDTATATPFLPEYATEDTTNTFNLLMFAFKFILIPALIGISLFIYVMSQKPERGW